MQNWIAEQTFQGLSQFDLALELNHPESKKYTSHPDNYLRVIMEECNFYDSLESLDWNTLLRNAEIVLDLGCGGGWLSSRLSLVDGIRKIYALDASRGFLNNLLPGVVQRMGGNMERIEPIEGLFTPLLFPDASLDVIVASSVMHHSDNLATLLRECRAKLKQGGRLLILNETPYSGLRHILSTSKGFLNIIANLTLCKYMEQSPSISSSGYFYDPSLGDRDYPLWYWREAITRSGFHIEQIIDTGLSTIKGKPGRSLKHFICQAI